MGAAMEKEPAREAFRQTPLDEQSGRAEQQDANLAPRADFLIPEPFHDFAPAGDFLDFIKHQQHALLGGSGLGASQPPLRFDPLRSVGQRRIGGRRVTGPAQLFFHLSGRGGFADLPRADQHLQQRRFPLQGGEDFANHRAPEFHGRNLLSSR